MLCIHRLLAVQVQQQRDKGVGGLRALSMGSACCAGTQSHVQIPSIHVKGSPGGI